MCYVPYEHGTERTRYKLLEAASETQRLNEGETERRKEKVVLLPLNTQRVSYSFPRTAWKFPPKLLLTNKTTHAKHSVFSNDN